MDLCKLICFMLLIFASCITGYYQGDARFLASKAIEYSQIHYVSTIGNMTAQEMAIFEDPQNIIVCKSSDTIMVHLSKFVHKSFKDFAFLEQDTKPSQLVEISQKQNWKFEDAATWVELRRDSISTEVGPLSPITGCLNCINGDGGVLAGKYTTTVGRTSSLDLLHGFNFFLILGLGYSFEIVSSVKISASYSCTVPMGKVGQVFLQPWYTRFHNPYIRLIGVRSVRTRRKNLTKFVSLGEWTAVDDPIEIPLYGSKPILLCVTDDEYLDCDGELVNGDFY